MSNSEKPVKTKRERRRGSRWLRRIVGVVAVLCLCAGFGLWLVTRSWFLVARIQPVFEERLGGPVRIGQIEYIGDGAFEFRNMELRAPGLKGSGAVVCEVGRARVQTDASGWLRGDLRITELMLSDLLIRLSENEHKSGDFNFMSLVPHWRVPEPNDPAFLPPTVQIANAIVEVGVHDAEDYTLRGQRRMTGSLRPHTDQDGLYAVALTEVDEHGHVLEEGGIVVSGDWNARTNEQAMRVEALDLDARAYGMCPQVVRLMWERMNLQGRVSEVHVGWSVDEDFSVEFVVDDVALTLPIDPRETWWMDRNLPIILYLPPFDMPTPLWATYRDGQILPSQSEPRMHVREGSIHLSQSSVKLTNMRGEFRNAASGTGVAGVPYRVSLELDLLRNLDWENRDAWLTEMLAIAPFQMLFRTDRFRVQEDADGQPQSVDLPYAAARMLERFQLRDWEMSTQIRLTRDAPQDGADGTPRAEPILTSGQAFIYDATGAYQLFPYPLRDITAHIEFDNEGILVDYLRGEGSGGAPVSLNGTITPPSMYPAVALRVNATNVPLDDDLRSALAGPQQAIFDALLSKRCFDGLREAYFVPTAEEIDQARLDLRELLIQRRRIVVDPEAAELVPLPGENAQLERVNLAVEALRRRVNAGPFELGGTIDLDLSIDRAEGRNRPTMTTGLLEVHDVCVVYEGFPYPMRVPSGTLRWDEQEISPVVDEGKGLEVYLPGGGRGMITGRVSMKRLDGRLRVLPDVTIAAVGDAVSDTLLAAVPGAGVALGGAPGAGAEAEAADDDAGLDQGGWPGAQLSPAAAWLREFSLTGTLDYGAWIGAREDGTPDYRVEVTLRDARADPTRVLTAMLGGGGLLQPRVWSLRDASAKLLVTRESVELIEFTGRHEHGTVYVDGVVDVRSEPVDIRLDVSLDDVELGDYLVDLLPAGGDQQLTSLWERYQPEGTFSASLRYQRVGGELAPMALSVEPDDVTLRVDGETLRLNRLQGALRINARQVRFEDLQLNITHDGRDDGVMRLTGSYGLAAGDGGEIPVGVEGAWMGGRLQSPLVHEALRRFGAPKQADQYRALQGEGSFDAFLSYHSARVDAPSSYELLVHPESVSFLLGETPVYFKLDEPGSVRFVPGRVELSSLSGEQVAGAFDLSGVVMTDEPMVVDLNLGYTGRLRSSQISAFLPAEVNTVFDALMLEEGEPSHVIGGRLHMEQVPAPRAEDDDHLAWRIDFASTIETNNASLEAGVTFDHVTGPLEIDLHHVPGEPVSLLIDADLTHARVLGQHLSNIQTTITMADDGQSVLLRDLRADAQHGTVWAEAEIGLGDNLDYRVATRLTDVPLSDFILRAPDEEDSSADQPGAPEGGVFAGLDLSGQRDRPDLRVGRGSVRIVGNRLAGVPLALQLLHLTLPGSAWEFAQAEFFINGDEAVFESILFESTQGRMISQYLQGSGRLDINTFNLRAIFSSRGGLPLVSNVIGEIGDQIAAIEVTGPLWAPEAALIPIPTISGVGGAARGEVPLVLEMPEDDPGE